MTDKDLEEILNDRDLTLSDEEELIAKNSETIDVGEDVLERAYADPIADTLEESNDDVHLSIIRDQILQKYVNKN